MANGNRRTPPANGRAQRGAWQKDHVNQQKEKRNARTTLVTPQQGRKPRQLCGSELQHGDFGEPNYPRIRTSDQARHRRQAHRLTAGKRFAVGQQAVIDEVRFTNVVSLSNASGNGIDIAARTSTGKLYFFEVKANSMRLDSGTEGCCVF